MINSLDGFQHDPASNTTFQHSTPTRKSWVWCIAAETFCFVEFWSAHQRRSWWTWSANLWKQLLGWCGPSHSTLTWPIPGSGRPCSATWRPWSWARCRQPLSLANWSTGLFQNMPFLTSLCNWRSMMVFQWQLFQDCVSWVSPSLTKCSCFCWKQWEIVEINWNQ